MSDSLNLISAIGESHTMVLLHMITSSVCLFNLLPNLIVIIFVEWQIVWCLADYLGCVWFHKLFLGGVKIDFDMFGYS
jgi:hypothetical protein